ncbi:MAG TPA: hypothetical protein VH082_06285 [Rudaea sp.]|nr:hypothetical protein [Rudaea sp.]
MSRSFALIGLLMVAHAASAQQVQVNKSFNPASVTLGATSVVTVTLQNTSTTSAATISGFTDDIASMGGSAQLLGTPTPTTTCTGGTPTVSGTAIVMSNGVIPIAPNASTPGSCTITFSVRTLKTGNGFNTIRASDVVTSNGSPSSDVTQTLTVQAANITTASGPVQTVLTGDTATVTYTLTNTTPVTLTNVTFPITSNATSAYTVSGTGVGATCGGTATLPAPGGTTGTTTFSGITIPASGACTVTLQVTTPTVETVNFTLVANAIADDQGATNSTGTSGQAKFVNGQPNVSKAFNPTSVQPGSTSTVTLKIQNVLTDQALNALADSDPLPAGFIVDAAAPTQTGCGGATLGGAGTGTFTISGATIAVGATCTITFVVDIPLAQAPATYTNTVPKGNLTATSDTGAAIPGAAQNATANLIVTAPGGGVAATKAAAPTSAGINTPILITLTFASQGNAAFTAGQFTDALPQTPVVMEQFFDGAAHAPTTTGCGGAAMISAVDGATSVTGSGLTIAAGGSCVVKFYVFFPNVTGPSRVDANTLTGISFTNSLNNPVTPTSNSVNITELPTFTVTNYVASASGLTNQPLTVSATVNVPTGQSDTNASITIPLNSVTPASVELAPTPNFTFANCPAGVDATSVTPAANGQSFSVVLGTINQTCTIGYDVIDIGSVAGTFTPGNPSYKGDLTGQTSVSFTGTNNVTFTAPVPIGVSKSFTPNQIQAGGVATAKIALVVPRAGTLAVTEAEGVAFTDNLPTNLVFSPTPNVTFTGCQQTAQPAPSFVITGTSIAFSNISLITNGTTQTTCIVAFDVTSNAVGAPLNQIPAGAVTSTAGAGATNTQTAKASLTVAAGLGVQKTFVNASFPIGGTDYIRLLVTNTATPSPLTGGSLADNMPTSLVLASLTEGPSQAGDPPLCGGSISGSLGSSNYVLNGLSIGGYIGGVAGQCVVYVLVTSSPTAVPATVANTIASGGLNIGGFGNQNPATGTVTLTAAPAVDLSKAFSATTIAPNGISTLTITVTNAASGAAALTGLALSDTLPTGVTIANPSGAGTTCGAGTVTATSGTSSVSLTGGSVAAGANCAITVSVTASTPGTYTNTIPANSVTSTQGASNPTPATASLLVAPPVTIGKTFLPTAVTASESSVLTIVITNTTAGSVALSGMTLTDNLPGGITVASTPNASTTCGAGAVAATSGTAIVMLNNGSVGAGASCAITVSVTGTVAGGYTNTIPASALTDTQGVTNATPATANLSINTAVAITKAFSPTSIPSGGTSTLTIMIPNTAAGSVALSGMTLTDTLPSGVTVASTPTASTTCGGGTVVATGGTVTLSSGSVAAGGTCSITVPVTATATNTYTNTIPPNSLTDTQNVTNTTPATANLTVTAPVGITKAFSPTSIPSGGTSTLTITIPNTATGSVALSGMMLTDTLPSGVTVASTPTASTTCGAGTVAASGGTVTLSGGSVAAGGTCSITVPVTATATNTYTNTIPANALTDTQNVTNTAPTTADLTITAPLGITKAFSPTSISSGNTSTLTITIPNTDSGAIALSGMALSDQLPAGVTVASTPNASTTCGGGTVTATGGDTTVALSGGSLAADASCTIVVSVTGTASGMYTNTIPANALTDTQNVTNIAPTTADLTISTPSVISKSFSPPTFSTGSTSTLTINIPNTAVGAVALTNMALTDNLPSGLSVASTPNASTTCGGSVSATSGATSVTLTGGSLAANATCNIVVSVTAQSTGSYTNVIPAGALTDTQGVTNTSVATAVVSVTPRATNTTPVPMPRWMLIALVALMIATTSAAVRRRRRSQ